MALEPGTVYLAPADYHLLIEEPGRLALSTDAPVRSARPSIDVLFETAADAYRRRAARRAADRRQRDGAEGLAAVKARGGGRSSRIRHGRVPHHAGGGARGHGGRLRAAARRRSEIIW